ncbi:MAG: hypothetical protein A3H35_12245 [Betaproteobacteria bacterium RIFCSPLOWO2_02_FULL_62_17]|nr:MAG: hypothetical protein A3H35_12245 [Betaproteobacteria bacterium RIFCSPLOWO2_02_FULL_62_17]
MLGALEWLPLLWLPGRLFLWLPLLELLACAKVGARRDANSNASIILTMDCIDAAHCVQECHHTSGLLN